MCGKSTHVLQLIEEHKNDFRGIYVSLQGEVQLGSLERPQPTDVAQFWGSFREALLSSGLPVAPASDDDAQRAVLRAFRETHTEVLPLVLVIDEMDLLLGANPQVKDLLLGFIRTLKTRSYASSVIGIGAYQVLQLGETGSSTTISPFNIIDQFVEQHFTERELAVILSEYAHDHTVSLPPSLDQFAKDLHASTDGHPGLSMYALYQYDQIVVKAKGRTSRAPSWDDFYHHSLWPLVTAHPCFQSLVGCVNNHSTAREYILQHNLLSSGSRSFVADLSDPAVSFLLNMGILKHATTKAAEEAELEWTCPVLRSLTLATIWPLLNEPPPIVPMLKIESKEIIDMMLLLKLLIPRISTKLLREEIVKNKTTEAPHEYAYQFELFALLQWALRQPHLRAVDHRVIPEAKDYRLSNQRADIVVVNHGRYVIEIGAHMSKKIYDEHYGRTITYVNNLKACCGVVINFSTETIHSQYFPLDRDDSVTCLNVHVDLDANEFNVWELSPREGSTEETLGERVATLSLKEKDLAPRMTPRRAKTPPVPLSDGRGRMAPQQLFLPKEEDSKPLINLWIHFGKALECMRDVDPLLRVIDMKGLIRSQFGLRAPFYLSKGDLDGQPLDSLKTLHEQGIENGCQIHAIKAEGFE